MRTLLFRLRFRLRTAFWTWLMKPRPRPDRILVDREGVAYTPTREVKLKAKKS